MAGCQLSTLVGISSKALALFYMAEMTWLLSSEKRTKAMKLLCCSTARVKCFDVDFDFEAVVAAVVCNHCTH
jgi:hypothetical protein